VAATVLGSATGALLPFVITNVYQPQQTDPYFLVAGSVVAVTSIFTVVLRGTVVPFAMAWRARGAGTAWTTAARISWQMAAGSTALTVVAVGVLVLVVVPRSSLTPDQARVVLECLVCLTPLPAIMTWCSVLCGLLYSADRFFLATWTEGLRSLVACAVLVLPVTGKPIWTVAAALTVGEGIRALVLRVAARNSLGLQEERDGPALQEERPADSAPQPLSQYWRVALTQVLSLSIGGFSPLIDRAFASTQPVGSVTALELAEKLFYTPMMLLASGVGLVVATRWARMAESGQWAHLAEDHRRWQVRFFACSAVVAVASISVVYAAESLFYRIVNLPMSIDFALLFAAYAIGLPFAMVGNLGARLFVACRNTRLLPFFALVLVTINTVGDAVGVALYGLTGIALASSAYRVVDAVLYLSFAGYVMRSARASRGVTEAVHHAGQGPH
jgi:peptidoglycan biosynthesis protein MviN/MurJ (putative lipid II flippase)